MLAGVDVSHWNGIINFEQFINEKYSEFMIAKVSEGVSIKDSRCAGYLQMCWQYDILSGVYHYLNDKDADKQFFNFAHAYESAVVDADSTIIAIDVEDRTLINAGVERTRAILTRFVDMVYSEYATFPIIYMSKGFMPGQFKEIGKICAGWVASWNMRTPKRTDLNTTIWQKSATGKVAGITGNVDLDVAYLTRESWKRIARPHNV